MNTVMRDFIIHTADVPGLRPGDRVSSVRVAAADVVVGRRYAVCRDGKPLAFGRVTYAGPSTLVIRRSIRRAIFAKSADLELWEVRGRWQKLKARRPSVPTIRHVSTPAA